MTRIALFSALAVLAAAGWGSATAVAAVKPVPGSYTPQAAGVKGPDARFELAKGKLQYLSIAGVNERKSCYIDASFSGFYGKIKVRGGRFSYTERSEVIIGRQRYVPATLKVKGAWSKPRLMSGRARVDVNGRVTGIRPGRLVRCTTGWIRFRLAHDNPIDATETLEAFNTPGEVRVKISVVNLGEVASPNTQVRIEPANVDLSGNFASPTAALAEPSGCVRGEEYGTDLFFTCDIGTLPAHGTWTARVTEQWDQAAVDHVCEWMGPSLAFGLWTRVTSPLNANEGFGSIENREIACPAG